jgi:serine/threonine protein kinase
LTEELASDHRARLRFRKEAKAIAATSHPNILAVYDAELEHPPFFLVTELLQGETLRRTMNVRLSRGGMRWQLVLLSQNAWRRRMM